MPISKNGIPYFTEEQFAKAMTSDLSTYEYAREQGYPMVKKGNHYCLAEHDSLVFFPNGSWKWFSNDKGGGLIDFIINYEGQTYVNAILIAAGELEIGKNISARPPHIVEKRELVLPDKAKDFNRVIAYLSQTRKIDIEIIYKMISDKKIFQTHQVSPDGKTYNNCAFVAYDKDGVARYCSLRSPSATSTFKQDVEGSDKSYGFAIEGKSNRVWVYESPIDLLSHSTLVSRVGGDWNVDHSVSLGGLSTLALKRYLQEHSEINEIFLCYDNDIEGKKNGLPFNHGQERAAEQARELESQGYTVEVRSPSLKDFNQDLVAMCEYSEHLRSL